MIDIDRYFNSNRDGTKSANLNGLINDCLPSHTPHIGMMGYGMNAIITNVSKGE